jgi:DnaK suppressor protein
MFLKPERCQARAFVVRFVERSLQPARAMVSARFENLRRILEERRRVIADDLRQIIRESCDGAFIERAGGELNGADSGDVTIQDDTRFAMMNLKAETLARIDDAMARLEDGRYGRCDDCGQEIPEPRLRALPFAFRCTPCEELREAAERRRRRGERTMPTLTDERRDYR